MSERYTYLPPNCIVKPPGPQHIVVQQVIGNQNVDKVIEIRLVVPRQKPAIEQVVDVLVKRLCITNVEVLAHKVVVRGSFEVKALYVACLPSQPVHAIEARHVRFTAAAHIPGCHYGLEADANAYVEHIDYSICRRPFRKLRNGKAPKWKKQKPSFHHKDDCHDDHYHDDHCHDDHYHDDHCHDDHYHDDHCNTCKPKHKYKHEHDCDHDHHHCKPDFYDDCKPKHPCKPHCYHAIDVTVIIRVHVKVSKDREVVLQPTIISGGQLPYKPKG